MVAYLEARRTCSPAAIFAAFTLVLFTTLMLAMPTINQIGAGLTEQNREVQNIMAELGRPYGR